MFLYRTHRYAVNARDVAVRYVLHAGQKKDISRPLIKFRQGSLDVLQGFPPY